MIALLALFTLARAPVPQEPAAPEPGAPGRIALLGRSFELEAGLARDLAGGGEVLRLDAGEPGTSSVSPLAQSGAPTLRLALDLSSEHAGDDRDAAARVRAARCIELAGGDAVHWHRLLVPGGAPSRLGRAILEAHAAGATVVASEAAAPFLGKWTFVARDALERPVRNPRRPSPDRFLEGLGLLRARLVDSSAVERGGPSRLVRAVCESGMADGLFLDGEVAWIEDPRAFEAHVAASTDAAGEVLVFDLSRARRLGHALREGRIALLGAGTRWQRRTRTLSGATVPIRCGSDALPIPAPSALDAGAVRAILGSREPCGLCADALAQWTIEADEDSRASSARASGGRGVCGLRLDVDWVER